MKYVSYILFCGITSTSNYSQGLLNCCVLHISHRPNEMPFLHLSPNCKSLGITNVLQKCCSRFSRQRSSTVNGSSENSGSV